jgi:orotidine 5'-phosphate decarboxylase subfamily 1
MLINQLNTRLEKIRHPLAQKVIALALQKKTNLCLSLDVTTTTEFLRIVEQLGPYIVMLKTHIDILEDFTPDFVGKLKSLAAQYKFFIFEDRKFADIGNTVKLQYAQGIYHIASWADFVTTHALAGEGSIKALQDIGQPLARACLMLVQMSSAGNLLTKDYQQQAIALSKKYPDFVAGFIAQERCAGTEEFLYCMPGINLHAKDDHSGQQYKTPKIAMEQGADILIVGRGLYQASDLVAEAKKYLE